MRWRQLLSNLAASTVVTVTGTGVTTYTYTANGRPILTSQHEGGYDFTTYAGVLTALAPGTMGRRWYASRNRVV